MCHQTTTKKLFVNKKKEYGIELGNELGKSNLIVLNSFSLKNIMIIHHIFFFLVPKISQNDNKMVDIDVLVYFIPHPFAFLSSLDSLLYSYLAYFLAVCFQSSSTILSMANEENVSTRKKMQH